MSDFVFTISYISLQIRHLQMIDKHYLKTIEISPICKKLFTDYQVKPLMRGTIFYVIERGVGQSISNYLVTTIFVDFSYILNNNSVCLIFN